VDSWGVLEWVYRTEPAMSAFRQRLDAAVRGEITLIASRITLGEITYNIVGRQLRGEIDQTPFDGSVLPWTIEPVDDKIVDEAAQLKARYPISYADAFVAALAIRYGSPVLTGDMDFLKLSTAGLLTVDWIGK
jgi:predicted nucleic acid-binding protein